LSGALGPVFGEERLFPDWVELVVREHLIDQGVGEGLAVHLEGPVAEVYVRAIGVVLVEEDTRTAVAGLGVDVVYIQLVVEEVHRSGHFGCFLAVVENTADHSYLESRVEWAEMKTPEDSTAY